MILKSTSSTVSPRSSHKKSSTSVKFSPPKPTSRRYKNPDNVTKLLHQCFYIIRTVCPRLTLLYPAKGTFNGDDAFILPFKAW